MPMHALLLGPLLVSRLNEPRDLNCSRNGGWDMPEALLVG